MIWYQERSRGCRTRCQIHAALPCQNETYEIEFEIIKTEQSKLGNTIRNIIYPFISRKLLPYAFKSPIEYIYSQKEEELVKQVYLTELNKCYQRILDFKTDIINLLIDYDISCVECGVYQKVFQDDFEFVFQDDNSYIFQGQ
jgi:hypothetical protein